MKDLKIISTWLKKHGTSEMEEQVMKEVEQIEKMRTNTIIKPLKSKIMLNKISQLNACFLLLYQAHGNYLPAHYFVGELLILETNNTPEMTVFLSYKAPVRLSNLFYDVDGIERKEVIGKSGAKYYTYKFNHEYLDKLPEHLKKLL